MEAVVTAKEREALLELIHEVEDMAYGDYDRLTRATEKARAVFGISLTELPKYEMKQNHG